MQASYAQAFIREMSCTPTEWLRWLPDAIGNYAHQITDSDVRVTFPTGLLHIQWQVLPPRAMGLARLPRLQVDFSFTGLDEAQRYTFMKRFDLYTHRGGG